MGKKLAILGKVQLNHQKKLVLKLKSKPTLKHWIFEMLLLIWQITFISHKKNQPNDNTLCINTSSNHPQFMKQLPRSIKERLSINSSNKKVFNLAKLIYKKSIKK